MRRETILNIIGLTLLGVCFALALGRVLTRSARESDPDVVTIRFAHWQLESRIRDALDIIARRYEQICAERGEKVRVEQMLIPERVYPNWLITQLVGGTAPDLIEIGMGINEERVGRYFEPISPYIIHPNPYNKGTELENVPWRETFLDGLATPPGAMAPYNDALFDYYGIPITMFTMRVFYNKKLYREIAGDMPEPTDYQSFIELCEKVQQYSQKSGRTIIPIAGSKYNAPYVMDGLMHTLTQKLAIKVDRTRSLRFNDVERAFAYFRGDWTLDNPEVVLGLEAMQQVAQYMQQGFLTLGREDATFYFIQERALMISTGSWDAPSLSTQAPFEVGVFRIPVPLPDHPRYGPYVLGISSEAGQGTSGPFGLSRTSKHPEKALDFLRFLSSKEGATIFTRESHWLPAVVGVEPEESIRPFMPTEGGYPTGFSVRGGGNTDVNRNYESHFHLLIDPRNNTDPFRNAMKPKYEENMVSDLWLVDRSRLRSILRNDGTMAALYYLSQSAPDDALKQEKFQTQIEAQVTQEESVARQRWELRRHGHPPERP